MLKERKYELVDELAQSLEEASTLIFADYRGLSVEQFDELRTELYKHGARFRVVKNTLTKRAAEKAGVEDVDEFFTGPTAIAFVTDGDMVATAKILVETAESTEILSLKGGLLEGRKIDAAAVGELAKLPAIDVLHGSVVGVIAAPLVHLVSLVGAPLRDVVGVLDARIRQLEEQGDTPAEPAAAEADDAEPDTTDGDAPDPVADQVEAPEEPNTIGDESKEDQDNGDN